MWRSAEGSVFDRLLFCQFRDGAESTEFLKFFLLSLLLSRNTILRSCNNSRRWRRERAQQSHTARRPRYRGLPLQSRGESPLACCPLLIVLEMWRGLSSALGVGRSCWASPYW